MPDKLPSSKRYKEYAVYWPSDQINPESQEWQKSIERNNGNKGKMKFIWQAARLDNYSAKIQIDGLESTGYWFTIQHNNENYKEIVANKMPAFPIQCPNCADNQEITFQVNLLKVQRRAVRLFGDKNWF
ncbi:hypothetical protein H1D32_24140 [Anaerobacillus sp. CMMVII]|uniref:hypothetical protein n=1 Tax=Anaerobacillus sp. CMMVII TaxID=2755588 RepID=UPI0021B7A045|nr:hypothetical protein [Anaerobacillus sp. CMMVII]MCT8140491.1 hypothetical protein [Anaerobacillus sp. CMMVII]